MAKFCSNCGTKLFDDALFCGECGEKCTVTSTPIQKTESSASSIAESNSQSSPSSPIEQDNATTQEPDTPMPTSAPAKKSKKKLLITLTASVLVIAITLTTIFVVLPMFNKKSDDDKGYVVAGKDYITFKSPDTRYYLSGADYLDTNQNNNIISLAKLGLDMPFRYSRSRFVSLDDCAYSLVRDKDFSIHKITYEDDPSKFYDYDEEYADEIKENNPDLKSAPISTEWLSAEDIDNVDDLHANAIMSCSYEWQYDAGYIYFYILPERELQALYRNTMYKFGRINIENKSVEFIGNNINVSDYVVYNDWVYYCDNGWNRENTHNMEYSANQAGLYKMRTDGSDRTKLLSYKCNDKDDYLHNGYSVYSELSVYNNKLYYIDNTDPFNSILHRMDLDGKDVEKVATKGSYEYTFDANTNKLYYVTSSYNANNVTDVKDIYEVNLDDFTETKFAEYAIKGDRIQISCVDSQLYFSSPYQQFGTRGLQPGTEDEPAFRGIYYDLNEKKATAAYAYATWETRIEGYGFTQKIITNTSIYWADYDPSDELFTFYN